MHQRHRNLVVALVLGVVTWTAAGCGSSFVYDHADDLLHRSIRSTLDTTEEQESWLERHLDALHRWHRIHELPRYAAFLRDARTRAADGLTREDAAALHERVLDLYRSLAREALPRAAAFLPTLTERQLTRWEARADERFTEQEELLDLPPDERRGEWLDRGRDALEDWIGDLTERQEALLADYLADATARERARLERDRRRTAMLLRLLRDDRHARVRAALHRWFLESPIGGGPKAHARLQAFLADLDATLSPDQRAHLLEELDDWVEFFESL